MRETQETPPGRARMARLAGVRRVRGDTRARAPGQDALVPGQDALVPCDVGTVQGRFRALWEPASPEGAWWLAEPETEPDDGLPPHSCVVRAMRRLLGDPTWAPPEVLALIRASAGMPERALFVLEETAPVRVERDVRVRVVARGTVGRVEARGRGTFCLDADVLICAGLLLPYAERRGHMVCAPVRVIAAYGGDPGEIGVVIVHARDVRTPPLGAR